MHAPLVAHLHVDREHDALDHVRQVLSFATRVLFTTVLQFSLEMGVVQALPRGRDGQATGQQEVARVAGSHGSYVADIAQTGHGFEQNHLNVSHRSCAPHPHSRCARSP